MGIIKRARGRPPSKKYIDYDYELAYTKNANDLNESMVEKMLRNGKIKSIYATKTILSGNQLEVEIYPEFTRRSEIPVPKVKKDRKAQRKLNDKNARKRFERLVNTNFCEKDFWITLTYNPKNYPNSMDEALKNIRNYIRRINYKRNKKKNGKAKYIYITEWSDEKAIRCHHHVIMNEGLTMDEMESTWILGKRNEVRRLDPDDDDLTGLATYLSKDPNGKKRWCASLNLKQPKERKNHFEFRKKHIREMAKNHNYIEVLMAQKYKGFIFKEGNIYFNEVNGRFYVKARLFRRKRE